MAGLSRRGRVEGLVSLSERVTELSVRIEGDAPFVWDAGQHVTLRSDLANAGASAFSISASPSWIAPGLVTLAVANGAALLRHVRLGSLLAIEGPFGALTWRAAPGALLAGAGTGLAPLRAIVHHALALGDSTPLVLLAGNRTSSDLLWHREFAALASEHPRFRYEPVVSRPDPRWTGRTGHVQEHLAAMLAELPPGSLAYLCGSTAMVEECRRLLGALGVPPERILSEADA